MTLKEKKDGMLIRANELFIYGMIAEYNLGAKIAEAEKYKRYGDYYNWLCEVFDDNIHTTLRYRIKKLEIIEHECECENCDENYLKNLIIDALGAEKAKGWLKKFKEAEENIQQKASQYIANKTIISLSTGPYDVPSPRIHHHTDHKKTDRKSE